MSVLISHVSKQCILGTNNTLRIIFLSGKYGTATVYQQLSHPRLFKIYQPSLSRNLHLNSVNSLFTKTITTPNFCQIMEFSTEKLADLKNETENKEKPVEEVKGKELSRKEKLKLAVKEYGSTVIVFHVTISLMSLGICYTLVSSGVDLTSLIAALGFSDESMSKLATTSGTFVAAYAIHKLFAPVRISITLGATPLIVRYLRKKGWIKRP